MNAVIVCGLGFGDEGKGATVDSLVRELDSKLVVRYSGGCQAGHNVVLPDGRCHTFSQFGAGTLAGANTFLGPQMIIDPLAAVTEANNLQDIAGINPWDMLAVAPNCLVTTFFHQAKNRIHEAIKQHGSCGMGIGATRDYFHRYGSEAITALDLMHDVKHLSEKLRLLKERTLRDLEREPVRDHDGTRELFKEVLDTSPWLVAQQLFRASGRLRINKRPDPSWMSDTIVFEGAQGILLDQYAGFHPYTTWSDVTPNPALELCLEWEIPHWRILGVTRAYSTRHGSGPFPANPKTPEVQYVSGADTYNAPNYQGTFRSGPLDLQLLRYAINAVKPHSIAVTCLDQVPSKGRFDVIRRYRPDYEFYDGPKWNLHFQGHMADTLFGVTSTVKSEETDDIVKDIRSLGIPVSGTSYGPTFQDRVWGE